MMSKNYCFLWLDGIFDEKTVETFPSISPAANFWQRGFVEALQLQGNQVDLIGHAVERVWPFGKLFIYGKQASFSSGMKGTAVGYINAPFIRGTFQFINYLRAAKRYLMASEEKPDYVMTFSCLNKSTDRAPANETAKYIRKHFGIPWVCIVADGAAPPGADGYVYLTWSSYKSSTVERPSVHIDGGVPDIQMEGDQSSGAGHCQREKILMYMGALTQHGGSTQLARAFHSLRDEDIQLWICGRGENPELARLAEIDRRIKLIGFVSESELNKLASAATAFANPRPGSFGPNKFNYPSKILHYLAYGKPVISTFTDGISPDYADVLMPIPDETEACLAATIHNVLNMEREDYDALRARIASFSETHTWAYQASRFASWLCSDLPRKN